MKVLLDTNVVLDVLLAREPFAIPASKVMSLVESGFLTGYVGGTSVTTLYYLLSRAKGRADAHELVSRLLEIMEIAPVDRSILVGALEGRGSDYEDNVLLEAARACNVDAIVTRDAAGFPDAPITVMGPMEFLASLADANEQSTEGRI